MSNISAVSTNSLIELLQKKVLEDNQDFMINTNTNKSEEISYNDIKSLINQISTYTISQGKQDINTILFIVNKQVLNINEEIYDDICISYFSKLTDVYKVT